MKKFIKPQLVIIVFAFCIAACSKKDDTASPIPPPNPPPQLDTKTLLMSKIWSIVKTGGDDNRNGTVDDAELSPYPARSATYFTFKADGTLVEDGGANGLTNPSIFYTWELVDKQTIKIYNSINDRNYYWHIKLLTADRFNFEQFQADNLTLTLGVQCVPK